MPGSSRRVRAMSDERPPPGRCASPGWRACRSTSTAPGCSSARSSRGPGGRTPATWARAARMRVRRAGIVVGILVAVLGHEVAHAVAARLLGFRVHRIVATLWGGHTAYDGTGTTPGRAAVIAVAGPLANLALAAHGQRDGRRPAVARIRSSRGSFMILNLLLAGVQPAARPPARRWPARAVAGLGGQRSPRPRAGRRRLVRPAARRGGRASATSSGPSPRATPTCSASASGWSWPGSSGRVRRRRCERAPLERLLAAGAPRGRHGRRWSSCRPSPRSASWSASAAGWWRSTSAASPRCCCPSRPRPRPTSRPCRPPRGWRPSSSRCPTSCVVELAPGDDAEPVLRAMATTGWGVVVVTSAGTVRGLVTSERLNAVAETVLGRN